MRLFERLALSASSSSDSGASRRLFEDALLDPGKSRFSFAVSNKLNFVASDSPLLPNDQPVEAVATVAGMEAAENCGVVAFLAMSEKKDQCDCVMSEGRKSLWY
jgi:hypothetical protein